MIYSDSVSISAPSDRVILSDKTQRPLMTIIMILP